MHKLKIQPKRNLIQTDTSQLNSIFIFFCHKQPENVLCISKSGNRIKIIDFGFARRYDPNKKLQVGQII